MPQVSMPPEGASENVSRVLQRYTHDWKEAVILSRAGP